MRIAPVLLLLVASPTLAGEPNFHERSSSTLVWHSAEPVVCAYYDGQCLPCYETIRREPNLVGELVEYRYPYECVEPAHEVSAIGVPLEGEVLNTGGAYNARSVRVLPNGYIKLE